MRDILRNTKGTAAMEFAICMPLMLSLVFGFSEFGRAIWCHHALTQMARDAARYASHNGTTIADAENLATYGSLTNTSNPVMPPSFGPVTVAVTLNAPVAGQVTAVATFTFSDPVLAWFNLNIRIPMAASHTEALQVS
jgi:Flp pilus assembly protein TadG